MLKKLMKRYALFSMVVAVLLLSVTLLATHQSEDHIVFNIPQTQAGDALNEYAQQAGLQLLHPYAKLQEAISNPVIGTFTRQDALERLLSCTGFAAMVDADDSIVIQKKTVPGCGK